MYTDHVISREEHDAWFDAALFSESARYWIVISKMNEIGFASISGIDRVNSRAMWAFYLGVKSPLDLFVLDAIDYLVSQHAFETLNINRLGAEVLSTNSAVLQLHERFGFQREALLRQYIRKADGPHDVVVLGLLREEWEVLRDGARARLESRGLLVESSR